MQSEFTSNWFQTERKKKKLYLYFKINLIKRINKRPHYVASKMKKKIYMSISHRANSVAMCIQTRHVLNMLLILTEPLHQIEIL